MNTTVKAKPAIEATVTGPVLSLAFANGKGLIVTMSELSDNILQQATMHGLKQKLVDAAAISRDPTNGKAATIDTKYDAIKEVLDRLLSGEWNKRREGGGATGGLLKRALIEMYDGRKTPEQIDEYLAGKDDKEKAALRKHPKVAEIIERIRAEDGKDTDSSIADDLLNDLEGM